MRYYLHKLSTLKVHIAVMCLFALAAYPLFCAVLSDYMNAAAAFYTAFDQSDPQVRASAEYLAANSALTDKGNTTVFIAVVGAISLIGMFSTGFAILIKCFRPLLNKNSADMEMTAPVSAPTRFFGSFFAGLTVYLMPHIISAAAGSALLGSFEYYDSRIMSLSRLSRLDDDIRTMMIYGLMMCVLFYCQTTLITAVSGKPGRVIKLAILLNIALPTIAICAGILSYNSGYGLMEGSTDEIMSAVGQYSPLGLLIEFAAFNLFGVREGGSALLPNMAVFTLYCAAFVIGAYLLVKHSRAERTGKPYVYPKARGIASAISVLAVTFFFGVMISTSDIPLTNCYSSAGSRTLIGMVLTELGLWLVTAFAIFTACEFADSKGERYRSRRFGKLLPYIIGSAAVVFACMFTEGFGMAYYIPAPDDVMEADIDISAPYIYLSGRIHEFSAEDITELHRYLLDGRGSPGTYDNAYVTINYETREGMHCRRRYYLTSEQFGRTFEVAKKGGVIENSFGINKYYYPKGGTVSVTYYRDDREITPFTVSKTALENALAEDLREITADDILGCRKSYSVKLTDETGNTATYLTVCPFEERTCELLGLNTQQQDQE